MTLFLKEKNWEAFCGYSADESKNTMEKSLKKLKIPFSYKEEDGRRTQNFILGTKSKVKTFYIKNPSDLTIKIIPVTGDPLYRFTLSLVATSRSNNLNNKLCLINISPINEDTKIPLQKLLNKFISNGNYHPSKINHPRFNISFGLNIKNKRKWTSW